VAKAYLDQLQRSQALAPDKVASLEKAIQNAERSHMSKDAVAELNRMASSLAQEAGAAKNQTDSKRLHALVEILEHPSA